ncbi:MAG: hypothetical protein JWR01_2064 [Subtercola sp.]|nr:hypothetical protein [Subtercola sp.]
MNGITSTRVVAVGLMALGMLGMPGMSGAFPAGAGGGGAGVAGAGAAAAVPSGPALVPASETAVGQGRGVWPTDAPHPVIRPFEAPVTRYSAGHRGLDVAAVPGQPVYAVLGGTVSFAGVVVDRPLVSVSHGDGLVSSVEPVTPIVTAGETVAAGQQIGIAAISSHCELGCVHLGLRLNGEYVSPLLLLGGIPRAVLLPIRAGPG